MTVPVAYEFQKESSTDIKTIRQRKVEEMLEEKKKIEDEFVNWKFKANRIPRTTMENLYEKLTIDNKERRDEVKRLSMAMTKQNEKPFNFYLRD